MRSYASRIAAVAALALAFATNGLPTTTASRFRPSTAANSSRSSITRLKWCSPAQCSPST